jgi:hypothetical protein
VPRPRSAFLAACALAAATVAAGCGNKDQPRAVDKPSIGVKGTEKEVARDLGFPAFATKNTTRIGGADPAADAVGAARAVFSGATPLTRPRAVALVDSTDPRAALAASVLMSAPVRAPMLFSQGRDLSPGTQEALDALAPRGSRAAGDAQIIRVGDAARPKDLRTTDIRGKDIFSLARALDAFQAAAHGTTSDRLMIVGAGDPAYAMPAAAWAAKSGDPILFTEKDRLPADTRAAIASHQQPKIYVVGPKAVVSDKVLKQLRSLGTVKRIQGPDPTLNSVAFARFLDGEFGWGVVDPGHGLVFAGADRPLDAGAAAPLSATGTYGPLIVVKDRDTLPRKLEQFLLDIQPGYDKDPVRGVYNHAWLIGDESVLSVKAQSRIDALLEIVPVQEQKSASASQ